MCQKLFPIDLKYIVYCVRSYRQIGRAYVSTFKVEKIKILHRKAVFENRKR